MFSSEQEAHDPPDKVDDDDEDDDEGIVMRNCSSSLALLRLSLFLILSSSFAGVCVGSDGSLVVELLLMAERTDLWNLSAELLFCVLLAVWLILPCSSRLDDLLTGVISE